MTPPAVCYVTRDIWCAVAPQSATHSNSCASPHAAALHTFKQLCSTSCASSALASAVSSSAAVLIIPAHPSLSLSLTSQPVCTCLPVLGRCGILWACKRKQWLLQVQAPGCPSHSLQQGLHQGRRCLQGLPALLFTGLRCGAPTATALQRWRGCHRRLQLQRMLPPRRCSGVSPTASAAAAMVGVVAAKGAAVGCTAAAVAAAAWQVHHCPQRRARGMRHQLLHTSIHGSMLAS